MIVVLFGGTSPVYQDFAAEYNVIRVQGPGLLFPLGLNLDLDPVVELGNMGAGLLLPLGLNLLTSNPPPPVFEYPVWLSWDIPTNNTDGSVLTDLQGFKIGYGRNSGVYDNVIVLPDPLATEYTFDVEAGLWHFNVRAYSTEDSAYATEIAFVQNTNLFAEAAFGSTYNITGFAENYFTSAYNIDGVLTSVEQPIDFEYNIASTVEADFSASYLIDVTPTNAWFARLTSTYQTWASRDGIPQLYAEENFSAAYDVGGTVEQDFVVSYSVSETGVIDGGGLIPDSVYNDIGPIYNIVGSAYGDLAPIYQVINFVERDLVIQFQIEGTVVAPFNDLSPQWQITSSVERDFVVVHTIFDDVFEDFSPQFSVLDDVFQDFASQYDVVGAASSTFQVNWDISTDLLPVFNDFFSVWSSVQSASRDFSPAWSMGGAVYSDRDFVYSILQGWTKPGRIPKPWTPKPTVTDNWTPVTDPTDSWSNDG